MAKSEMTREEAIHELEDAKDGYAEYLSIDAINMAIKALEAEPCEDAISRQAALDAIETWDKFGCDGSGRLVRLDNKSESLFVPYIHYGDVVDVIKGLTTVLPEPTDEQVAEYCKRRCLHIVTDDFFRVAQPEPKEGYWIKHTDPFDGEQYECSECGVLWEFNDGTPEDNEAYFCPHCGKKMTISTK